jgi:hypothetical protein
LLGIEEEKAAPNVVVGIKEIVADVAHYGLFPERRIWMSAANAGREE